MLKPFLTSLLLFAFGFTKAQKIDSIYVHLYTDSLKIGEYNYINIDGKLPNGRYLPLDTTELIFSSDYGKFFGNSLYLEPGFSKEKVHVKVVLKSNPEIQKQFYIWIKTIPNPARLKTLDQILNEPKRVHLKMSLRLPTFNKFISV